ncbi:MAG TPA: translation initiation factor [Candidatus Thermoplasmatota archaeon]|nr:translation initiation factor [Candidatus Thermoplasmatota archaeon]
MVRDIDKELGLDDILAIEGSVVTVRVDNRRYGKSVTVLQGFDAGVDLHALAKELKHHLGTGGTSKDGVIELQGEHREKAKAYLRKLGYNVE